MDKANLKDIIANLRKASDEQRKAHRELIDYNIENAKDEQELSRVIEVIAGHPLPW